MPNHQLEVLNKFYLLGLTAQQQQVARGIMLREADTFSADDTEISDIDMHKMKIPLKGQVAA